MKILVTGANGYIGNQVVKSLCDKGVDVIATDIVVDYIDSRATIIKENIFREEKNWFEIFSCPDVCLHLAWRDGFAHNSINHMGDLSGHYKFLCNMIDSGLKQLAVMGTMHEVGYYEGCIDEKTQCNPLSNYGVAKNALRQAIELYCKQSNCKYQWLRGFYMYSADVRGSSIFCKLMQANAEGKASFPFTSGKNKYDFISVDELVEQVSLCIMQDEVLGIINCCSGRPISLKEQVEWFIKENGLKIVLDYNKFPDRPYDSPCIYGDNKKIMEILRK